MYIYIYACMCVEWMVETEKNRASLSVEHVFANHTFLYFGVRDKLPSAAATQQSSPEPFTLTPSVRLITLLPDLPGIYRSSSWSLLFRPPPPPFHPNVTPTPSLLRPHLLLLPPQLLYTTKSFGMIIPICPINIGHIHIHSASNHRTIMYLWSLHSVYSVYT